ncbi:uncharacterized protein Jarid2 isoform X3 [Diabrotica undecimpunctata]|uniref:uncharacterized protein Jarid2 isoform X3 n=1 Tax=Diabrotica undecimpunctata TaxID=50387 RepID=UPI003B6361F1
MKRKRKNACPSPLLDDSPKRTKVHAQRKFAQGSNVNSPVITPIRELEAESPKLEGLPEPVELLPIKRPNTEDFLTFLCFRGTPVLPANLNFFNTASIVDTNGQVHEIKSETSLKHGPIDIAKCGTSSEKPFVAFGVRKRADPVVISRQMDRKRRHALALQALRRKYQEQKMAKIRALTISKLSEKVTNKTLVRTNTVSKTETITKKNSTLQKTKVVATKHIKVTTLKTTLKPKMKQNMCLRSFRGRFIQQELPFRKKMGQNKRIVRNAGEKRTVIRKRNKDTQEKATLPGTSKQSENPVSQPIRRKLIKKIVTPSSDGSRFTRSSLTNTKSEIMRKQIKRILIPNRNNNPLIKTRPRSLRLTTVKKSVLSRRKSNSLKTKQRMRAAQRQHNVVCETTEKTEEIKLRRSPLTNKIESKQVEKKDIKETISKNVDSRRINRNTDIKKDFKKVVDIKKENSKVSDRDRRQRTRSVDVKKEINKSSNVKKKPTSSVEVKKSSRISNVIRKNVDILKSANKTTPVVHNKTVKSHTEESSRRSSRNLDNAKKPKTHTQEAVIEDNKTGNDEKGKKLSAKNIKCKNPGLRGKMTLTKSNPLKVLKYKQKMDDQPPDLVKTENKCSEKYKQEEINNDTVIETKTIQTRIEDQPSDVPSVETVNKHIVNIEPIEKINQENECSDEDPDEKGLVIDEDYKENEIDSKQSVSQNEIEDKKVNSESIDSIESSEHSKDIDAQTAVKHVDDLNHVEETVDLVIEIDVQTVDIINISESKQDEQKVESSESVGESSNVVDESNTLPECAENDREHKSSDKETKEKEQIIDNVTIKSVTKRKDKESVKESIHTAKDDIETIKKTTKTKSSTRKDVKEQHLRAKCEDDNVLPRSQRPSRKTKEAAAIYMEILSHKLVNDNQKDDDNVSIDSFPELPNVKKTEQREIELKAKAKTSKDENKDKLRSKNEDVENIIDKEDVKNTNAELVEDDNWNDEVIPKTKSKEGKIGKRKIIPDNLIDSDETVKSKIKSDTEKQTSTTEVQIVLNACDILQQSKSSVEKDNVVEELKSELNKEVIPDQPEVKLTRPKIEKSECTESTKPAIEEPKVLKISEHAENKEIIEEDITQKLRKAEQTDNVVIVVEDSMSKLKTSEEKEKTDVVAMPVVVQEPTPKLKKSEQKVKIETDAAHAKLKLKTTDQTETPDKLSEQTQPKTRKIDQIETSGPVIKDLPSKLKKSRTNNSEVSAETKDNLMDKDKIVSKPTEINESPKKKSRKTDVPMRKSDPPKVSETTEESKTRRFTRHSLHATRSEDCDSDESFHIDVKVPRKKKNTRSRGSQRSAKGTKQLEMSSSDSDRSTTSDINTPTSASKSKYRKFTKTKPARKLDTVENTRENMDTDEEKVPVPKNDEPSQKSLPKEEKPKDNAKDTGKLKKSQNRVDKLKSNKSPEPESTKVEPKPKRECAKLPQNYLPMLSSSDEDEIFHGFDEKTAKNTKSCETSCGHAPPLLDLLNKDLGRRFGKEKVNMSKEQIEKWLKDAALAGSSLKKENDEMLKFGERIPTETNMELAGAIDTEKLKQSLSELSSSKHEVNDSKSDSAKSTPIKTDISKLSDSGKPQLDRKLIFRKSKTDSAPNLNAFSPENESSVYAFGEENDEAISTPFRRPSRRPSSTATSKSEDESCKHDESSKSSHFRKPSIKQDTPKGTNKDESEGTLEAEDSKQFYVPQKPTAKSTTSKAQNKQLFKSKSSEKLLDIDEFKYKIPSSPSASSSSSAKLYKRQPQKQKTKAADAISPVYVSDFPKHTEPAKLVEAPVFHPTDQEFQDPLEYIERIRHKAEQFGICKIVPPSNFKPECKVTDDMRFTAYNQYVNKMLYRWGPNYKEFVAIKKYLETQSIALNHPPWIGGMEIDLPRLYQTVQSLGGLREVIEKKKWSKVSDIMKIPKSAQDRVTKLDDIYCKYLLPYDILSPDSLKSSSGVH